MAEKNKKTKKKTVIETGREKSWRSEPTQGIPEYKAELDKFCPRAQVWKYNNDKRSEAAQEAKGDRATDWIRKTLQSKFENVPLKLTPSLRAKAVSSVAGPESMAEVEILQKVIVRENLIGELHKLLQNQNDVSSCLGEVVEIVKAVRYQTVDIVEDIDGWQSVQPTARAFLYRGINYLVKIFSDLNFLDSYEEIVEKFCFEFTANPLAYRGGGDIATGPGGNASSTKVSKLSSSFHSNMGWFDGIEAIRLRNAEKTIQREFDRIDHEKRNFKATGPDTASSFQYHNSLGGGKQSSFAKYTPMSGGAGGGGETPGTFNVNGGGSTFGFGGSQTGQEEDYMLSSAGADMGNGNPYGSFPPTREGEEGQEEDDDDNGDFPERSSSKSKKFHRGVGNKKWRQKFNGRKVKMERIAALTEEANELKAMQVHLEEQINVLVEKHRTTAEKRKVAETRRKEAVAVDRDAAAQHFVVEISIATADMQDINSMIKDLQRQSYFIG